MRKPAGYGVVTNCDSGSVVLEMDSAQCCHCQRHIWVKPGSATTVYLLPDLRPGMFGKFVEEPGAWCARCDAPVCLPCHDIGVCQHFLQEIERSETLTAQRDIRARLGIGGPVA